MKTVAEDSVLVKKVVDNFWDAVVATTLFRGEVTHMVKVSAIVSICDFLKTDPDLRMNYLVDVIGVDYYAETPRFEVVYHLYSLPKKHRIRLKVRVNEGDQVPSVTHIWSGANWPEREAFDMFGIVFEGHPDLRRIYMAEDWQGHPLRKDYPLRGYKDRYNPYGMEREEEWSPGKKQG
ncbi:MAG: NADH-quinone oxidoreductase subunit C [Deltaproteobacteria bacterium]|nr:NADH-quinone oxidoreductase subunit C [Deltaproteobacteria bacterium]